MNTEEINQMLEVIQPTLKAEDLRIGNWIHYLSNEGKKEVKVSALQFVDGEVRAAFPFKSVLKQSPWYDLQPIQLNSEILEKFGFEYHNSLLLGERWVIEGKMCIQPKKGRFWFLSNNGEVQLDYLHQLQNLFFALTGEELTINL